ncbi:P-loop containing nucleoside triphosphate hydrolase protein [Hypoxylon rubiginosum]|uniref:P-loop containing nucleoside triphosphate hydrolase protein n=1 Tax=Hypoxylon rubiginosum TaxID=110542 RepID=A0ACB9YW25_9PEZI|nr:P-loop containing nucleoside triphosphate hydrolase protein [Hypoxylon rubiginosum]
MDYQSIHGQDISSFDLTSTHRLPTVSAAQALEDLGTDPRRFVSTNIESLDQCLNDVIGDTNSELPRPGGLQKGQVVEIWGPPGSGKTAFGIQLAANTLRQDEKVVWVDGFHPVSPSRLHDLITSAQRSSPVSASVPSVADQAENLLYFQAPTLAHLIGLICKPTANSIPSNTSLIVLDALSSLVNYAYPRSFEARRTPKGPGPGPSARRLQVFQFLISTLQKLAATRDICVVLLSQCASRMQFEHGATLIPAVNANTWEQGIATRLVLFRDWIIKNDTVHGVYFAGIQKLNGKMAPGSISQVFAFGIRKEGLVSVDLGGSQPSLPVSPNSRLKRKLNQTDFEVADSEGEDYGWEDEDELEMPSMPPQWQGSEDILLGQVEDDETRTDEGLEDQSLHPEEAAVHLGSDLSEEDGGGSV